MVFDHEFQQSLRRLYQPEIESFCVGPETSIRNSIRVLQESPVHFCLVLSSDKSLIGTITDGDIRRALLRGNSLDSKVVDMMNTKYESLHESASTSDVVEVMRRAQVQQLPLLDDHGQVSTLVVHENFLNVSKLPNAVLIMAGGEGRRLRPLTESVPKPLIHIGDKPLLEILIQTCATSGIEVIFISVKYLADKIVTQIGDGSRWGIDIRYIREEQPLGTGGAVGLIGEKLHHPLLVMNGDVLTRVDLRQLLNFHESQGAIGTICTRQYEVEIPFGVVEAEDSVFYGIIEKPVSRYQVNAGIYVLSPEMISKVPQNQHIDMPDVIRLAQQHGPIAVFPIHEYWTDIGSHESLEQVEMNW